MENRAFPAKASGPRYLATEPSTAAAAEGGITGRGGLPGEISSNVNDARGAVRGDKRHCPGEALGDGVEAEVWLSGGFPRTSKRESGVADGGGVQPGSGVRAGVEGARAPLEAGVAHRSQVGQDLEETGEPVADGDGNEP